MEKYKENVEKLNSDPIFIEVISPEKDAQMIYNTLKEEAREEGRAEGREEGRAEGRAEGITQGITQGRKEGIKKGITQGRKEGLEKGKLETAKNLLINGIDINMILKCTGLSKDKLNALKDKD